MNPVDAFLFAQINNGNAISLAHGEAYTYKDRENLENVIMELFSQPFGQGYPPKDAERKKRDSLLLKKICSDAQIDMVSLPEQMDASLTRKILTKKNVIDHVIGKGTDCTLSDRIQRQRAGDK